MTFTLKRRLEVLDEKELRTILLHQWSLFSYVEEGKISEKEWLKKVNEIKRGMDCVCDDRLYPFRTEEGENAARAHIVFSESSKGALQLALRQKEKNREKVLALSQMFSIGPIKDLEKEEGMKKRTQWLFDHLVMDDEEWMHMEEDLLNAIENVRSIPSHMPVTVWVGPNAHEQTGLRFVLHLLDHHSIEIYPIQAEGSSAFPLHTGELSPGRFVHLLDHTPSVPITKTNIENARMEWQRLSEENTNLRVWEDGIKSTSDEYFDPTLIQSLIQLQKESERGEFIKAARLIGEVLGHSSQVVGDSYFEYRVRELVFQGEFRIKGVPRGMRYYAVKWEGLS